MEAVVCIFAPALDQFEVPAEISSYGAHSSQLSYCVIYAVILCNFFLVIFCKLFRGSMLEASATFPRSSQLSFCVIYAVIVCNFTR